MIDRAEASDPSLLSYLRKHPRVSSVVDGGGPGVRFQQGDWHRSVTIGDATMDVCGLVELMDNNPLVCADHASVPDAGSTLALIALGPLVRAGLIYEAPTFITNFEADADLIGAFLSREGWCDGVTYACELVDLGPVRVGSAIVAIHTPKRLDDIDDLFAEAYGRSFFVRREEDAWDIGLVHSQAFGAYKMRISPEEPTSLLSIQAMGDVDGKCGAAQIVHCMNVMAGFEETLGIAP